MSASTYRYLTSIISTHRGFTILNSYEVLCNLLIDKV